MAEIRYIRGSTAPRVPQEDSARDSTQQAEPALETDRHCAYNETRRCFVATEVDIADGRGGAAEARLHTMEPGSGMALWISPFQGISPSCARFPLDLVFLDADSKVLETVEFFPMSVGGEASAQAASILVLAADSLAQVQVKAGDHLTITARKEMLHRLPGPKHAEAGTLWTEAQVGQQNGDGGTQRGPEGLISKQPVIGTSIAPRDASNGIAAQSTPGVPERIQPGFAANGSASDTAPAAAAQPSDKKESEIAAMDHDVASAIPAAATTPSPVSNTLSSPISNAVSLPSMVETPGVETFGEVRSSASAQSQREPWKKEDPPRTWLERVLLGDNRDPRSFPRLSPPELFAYFFTGGPPAAHPVRNISTSGLYIVTGERWYLGTIVQLTLTDRLRPKGAQSISLFAKVMRTGMDGVGLKFLLEGLSRRRVIRYDVYEPTNGISVSHIGEFVKQFSAP
jgi:hypothetical protein